MASKCGLTNSNYKQLQMLYDKYNSKGRFGSCATRSRGLARTLARIGRLNVNDVRVGLQILAFPCNQFGKQEPGSSSEILRFVRDEMKVSFPIMKKVRIGLLLSSCEWFA